MYSSNYEMQIFCAYSVTDKAMCDLLCVSEDAKIYFLIQETTQLIEAILNVEFTSRTTFDALAASLPRFGFEKREFKML